MPDPNKEEFDARVLRLRREHALGRGFDAGGALGRSAFRRAPHNNRTILRVGLFVMAFAFGMKGALYHHLGPETYADRVSSMASGGGLAPVQSILLGADPVTLLVSGAIGQVTARL